MTTTTEYAAYPLALAAAQAANVWRNEGAGTYVFNDMRHSFTARTLAELEAGIVSYHAKRAAAEKRVAARVAIERRIVRRAVRTVIAAGYSVSVYDGEGYSVKRSRKVSEIMANIGATDTDQLRLRDAEGNPAGMILCVYGNDGHDVIADYSASLEEILGPVNVYADTLAAN